MNEKNHEICLNLECLITFEDRVLFIIRILDFETRVQKQALLILMRDYKNKIINVTKFIVMNLYFSGILEDNLIFVKILMKIYSIENLKVNMLIETNVFTSHKFILNYIFYS